MTAIAERYARAIGSSHLEWKIEPGAIDMLTAAGMLPDSLGVGLLRLRAEFDSICKMPGARLMIPHLKNSRHVRARLISMMQDAAHLPLHLQCDDGLVQIATNLLDLWLSPECPACTGRGVIGEYGTPQCLCTACSGSTRRSLLWKQEDQKFVESVSAEMELRVDDATRKIRRLLERFP